MQDRVTLDAPTGPERQFVTFFVGEQLMGVDIRQVQEINRHLKIAPVPHAPAFVRGVLNLRGDVVTVLDLRTLMGLEPCAVNRHSRNIILDVAGEKTGVLVDRVAEVVTARVAELEPTPANVSGVDGRFFEAVCKLDGALLVILNVEAALAAEGVQLAT